MPDPVHRCRVLVAAATADEAASLRALLLALDCDVRAATDGPAAVDAAAEYQPDFAFLDIRLNGLDGYEVARRLRALPELADLSLVALAGHDADADRIRARADGFAAFLTPPIDPEQVRRIVGR
jgi:CheY-like chemotaxis protein